MNWQLVLVLYNELVTKATKSLFKLLADIDGTDHCNGLRWVSKIEFSLPLPGLSNGLSFCVAYFKCLSSQQSKTLNGLPLPRSECPGEGRFPDPNTCGGFMDCIAKKTGGFTVTRDRCNGFVYNATSMTCSKTPVCFLYFTPCILMMAWQC